MCDLVNYTADAEANEEQFERNQNELKQIEDMDQLMEESAKIVKENFIDVLE